MSTTGAVVGDVNDEVGLLCGEGNLFPEADVGDGAEEGEKEAEPDRRSEVEEDFAEDLGEDLGEDFGEAFEEALNTFPMPIVQDAGGGGYKTSRRGSEGTSEEEWSTTGDGVEKEVEEGADSLSKRRKRNLHNMRLWRERKRQKEEADSTRMIELQDEIRQKNTLIENMQHKLERFRSWGLRQLAMRGALQEQMRTITAMRGGVPVGGPDDDPNNFEREDLSD